MSKAKSINGLMKHLHDNHNIKISGSYHKRKLSNFGYYHGYKGYRYIRTPNQKIPFTDFSQVIAINDFDMQLKALFYPYIMIIETALKNYVLECLFMHTSSNSFEDIYKSHLRFYKSLPLNTNEYKKQLAKRLRLQTQIYSVLSREYTNERKLVQHFYHGDTHVPIWAIFEVITMGEFGSFVSCMDVLIKDDVAKAIHLNTACNADHKLVERIIYVLKDLRNAVAHNDVVFDTRFQSGRPNAGLIRCLEFDTSIRNITFNTIVDYFILVVYLLKNFKVGVPELRKLISTFENLINVFRNQMPISIFNQIFYTDTRNKLTSLRTFIAR